MNGVPSQPGNRTCDLGYGVELSWITDGQGVDPRHAPWILKEDGTWLVEVSPGSRSPAWRQAIAKADEMDRRTLADPALAND